jgi:hypothetical protein
MSATNHQCHQPHAVNEKNLGDSEHDVNRQNYNMGWHLMTTSEMKMQQQLSATTCLYEAWHPKFVQPLLQIIDSKLATTNPRATHIGIGSGSA